MMLHMQIADYNGDGANDLIVVTKAGIFAYTQIEHYAGFQISAMMLTLIIAIMVVYFTQQYDAGGRRERKLRSTEYMD